ncbi:MAG: hypothetical protein EOO05_03420 [Chitinophagaceae bacterium]|nr:MAG: hypothetical protein EOO05_03420 [Chitinophagaceae bacterium]
MTKDQLTIVLERMTGHLQPITQRDTEQLKTVRRKLAGAMLADVPDDTGHEQLFMNSDMHSRERINAAELNDIASIAENAITKDPDNETQFFIRSTPVLNPHLAGSVPDWALGAKPSETYGPFLDAEGRETWIDFYRIEKLITLYVGNQPILLFKAVFRSPRFIIAGSPALELATKYTLVAGSVWFHAQMLAAASPAQQFGGLQVSGGTIDLTEMPQVTDNKLVIPAASTVTVKLKLVQAPDAGTAINSPYGSDARAAAYTLPADFEFTIRQKKITITGIPDSNATAFGQSMDFTFTPSETLQCEYLNSQLLVPWKCQQERFSITSVKSEWITADGDADIKHSFWAIPSAALNIGSPVVAHGNGAVFVNFSKGVSVGWTNLENEEARLNDGVFFGAPGLLMLTDIASTITGASQHFDLWKDELNPHGSDVKLSFRDKSPFLFSSLSEQEMDSVSTIAQANVHADRPVKVNKECFRIAGLVALIMAATKSSRKILLVAEDLAGLQQPAGMVINQPVIRREAIALENGLFTVSPVLNLFLFGEVDKEWQKVERGNIFLSFRLFTYLPTLPDPYVANVEKWRVFLERGGVRGQGATELILICAVRYAGKNEESDEVVTSFHFGGQAIPGLVDLMEEPASLDDILAATRPAKPGKKGSVKDAVLSPKAAGKAGRKEAAARLLEAQAQSKEAAVNATRMLRSQRFGAFAAMKTSSRMSVNELIRNAGAVKEGGAGTGVKPDVKTGVKPGVRPGGRIPDIKIPGIKVSDPVFTPSLGNVYTNPKGERYTYDELVRMGIDLEQDYDDTLGLNREYFSLLDVSSNANQLGVSIGADLNMIRTGSVTKDADGNGRIAQAATGNMFPFIVDGMQVKLPGNRVRLFTLPLVAWEPEFNLTPPDTDNPDDAGDVNKLAMDPQAGPIYHANDGGPSRFWNNNFSPVPLAPIPAARAIVQKFQSQPDNYTMAAITLPFGMKGIAYISAHFEESEKPQITNLRPVFRKQDNGDFKLEGGIQLSMTAGNFGKKMDVESDNDSPMFPGYVVQFNNLLNLAGMPSGASNLGHRVTQIYNNEFLLAPLKTPTIALSRGLPVSRMDITGYGANMFSNWLSPTAAMAQTSQARFDILMGRTGHEVVQVKSIIYPWGIRVVRTITIFRAPSGYVYRTDSGWKAQSDGLFDFGFRVMKAGVDPYGELTESDFTGSHPDSGYPDPVYEFHPGVIRGLYNVRNIKDAPSVAEFTASKQVFKTKEYINGIKGQIMVNDWDTFTEDTVCGGVYFDADVEIENVVQGSINGTVNENLGGGRTTKYGRVVSKKVLGYVQTAPAGKPIPPDQLVRLLNFQGGSIGGQVDCEVIINDSLQQMHISRFDVSPAKSDTGTDVFVVAARGPVYLPKDGSWALVQHDAATGIVTQLPNDTSVPLIRTGKRIKEKVIDPASVLSSLARIAHPLEILRAPGNTAINFGFLQNTGTQKALFLTPSYAHNVQKLLSRTPPVFADAYRLMTSNSLFPNIGNALDNFGSAMPMLKAYQGAVEVAAFDGSGFADAGTEALAIMDVLAHKSGETVLEQGMKLLQKTAAGKALEFVVPQLTEPIYLVKTDAVKIYIEYAATPKEGSEKKGKLDFNIDSFTGEMEKQWKSRMNNVSMVVDLSDMKRIMIIKGNFDSKKGKESNYEGGDAGADMPLPEIEFGPALDPVVQLLEILSTISTGQYADTMRKGLKIAMGNSGEIWEYKFEATKEIAMIRFPPTDEAYNSAQTPLKLEASMSLGVYFNAALKVTTDPSQLLPTAGAFIQFHGGLSVMCASVGVASIYAVGSVDVKLRADTSVGPGVDLKFGFGVSIVVSLPVIGNVSVTYMMAIEMHADSQKLVVAIVMMFRGQASLAMGMVCVTITIEAKGTMTKQGDDTTCTAQLTFALDISIFMVIDISFSRSWSETRQIA